MSDHDLVQYEALKGIPETEFYTLFKLHEERIKKINAHNKRK